MYLDIWYLGFHLHSYLRLCQCFRQGLDSGKGMANIWQTPPRLPPPRAWQTSVTDLSILSPWDLASELLFTQHSGKPPCKRYKGVSFPVLVLSTWQSALHPTALIKKSHSCLETFFSFFFFFFWGLHLFWGFYRGKITSKFNVYTT